MVRHLFYAEVEVCRLSGSNRLSLDDKAVGLPKDVAIDFWKVSPPPYVLSHRWNALQVKLNQNLGKPEILRSATLMADLPPALPLYALFAWSEHQDWLDDIEGPHPLKAGWHSGNDAASVAYDAASKIRPDEERDYWVLERDAGDCGVPFDRKNGRPVNSGEGAAVSARAVRDWILRGTPDRFGQLMWDFWYHFDVKERKWSRRLPEVDTASMTWDPRLPAHCRDELLAEQQRAYQDGVEHVERCAVLNTAFQCSSDSSTHRLSRDTTGNSVGELQMKLRAAWRAQIRKEQDWRRRSSLRSGSLSLSESSDEEYRLS